MLGEGAGRTDDEIERSLRVLMIDDPVGNLRHLPQRLRGSDRGSFCFNTVAIDLNESTGRATGIPSTCLRKAQYKMPLMVSSSNHERLALRQAQGERVHYDLRASGLRQLSARSGMGLP